jgi:CubicO group peptidase (beta-lactamase class C family)
VAHGTWDPAFEPLIDGFRANFAEHGEVGAALCVIVDGRTVVDAWAGVTSLDEASPWTGDTLVNAFSVGKGVTAALAAHCVASGHLSWDTRVAQVWPEFGTHGKESLTLSDLLGHRAALPGIRELLPDGVMLEWDTMTSHLAGEAPWWAPGTEHGYHVNTFGFLVGETLRRATGTGVRELFLERLFAPLEADLHMGLSPDDHHRVSTLIWNDAPTRHGIDPPTGDDSEILQHRAYANPPGLSGVGWVNSGDWRSAIMPSTNMHASARGVARLFSTLAQPGLLLPAEVLRECSTETSDGIDCVLGRRTRFGRGFQLPIPERSFGPNSRAFGHFGAGGSLGFTDPDAGIGFGYVMNKMGSGWQNERNSSLVRSLYECL